MQNSHDAASLFHDTYKECRDAFLVTVTKADAALSSFVHPDVRGPSGETLAIDVALLGPAEARRLLVMCAGTHGNEGFVGSALQIDALIRYTAGRLDDDGAAILLVHGVNPYGWAHRSRTNENQVDLNRNFVDFSGTQPEHSLAAEIQAASDASTPNGPDFVRIGAAMQMLIERHGLASVSDALQQGQYFKADGVGFGGSESQWSTRSMTETFARFFAGRDKIALIDWHTGLGGYGEPMFLCFDPPGSDAWSAAAAWWGEEALREADKSYASGTRPVYSGLLMGAAQRAARAAGAEAVGAVVEFGTFEPLEAAQCLWIDRWLRNQPADADPEKVEALYRHVQRFFYPNEPKWNATSLAGGRAIIDQAYKGLSSRS